LERWIKMRELTTREKAHKNKLVRDYNELLAKKKEAYDKVMAYEEKLAKRE